MYLLYAVLFCVMVKSRLAPDRKWQSLIQAAARPHIIKTGRFQDNMLNRFSRGKLHSCDVVDIVADAVDDGMLSSGDLFFKIGRSSDRHNAERNVWRAIQREHLGGAFSDCYHTVACGRKDGEGNIHEQKYNVILPHLLCKELHSMPGLFNRIFLGKAGCVESFWEHASQQPWFLEHPAAQQVAADPSHCVPLRIHGDAAPVTKHSSTLVMTFCSAVVHDLPSLESRQLMIALNSKAYAEMDEIMEMLAWSFSCLMDNKMPSNDHTGQPLQGKYARFAGEHITGDYKLILCHVVGDWEFLRDYFCLDSHYNRDDICFLCPATKTVGRMCAWCFDPDAPWSFHPTINREFMRSRRGVIPICYLPWIHIDCIKLDLMHIVMLGMLQYIIGSTMFELLRDNCWADPALPIAGIWKDRFATQLEQAYKRFKVWTRENFVSHNERPFTVARLSLECEPLYKGKAANTFKVALWLASVCADEAWADNSEHNQLRANVLFGITQSVTVCKQAGLFLSDLEARELERCPQTSLYCLSGLSHEAKRSMSLLWPMKPKMHMYDHALRRAQRDREHSLTRWCFADQDFVGTMAKVARSCHDKTREVKTIHKYLLLRSLLHGRSWRLSRYHAMSNADLLTALA